MFNLARCVFFTPVSFFRKEKCQEVQLIGLKVFS